MKHIVALSIILVVTTSLPTEIGRDIGDAKLTDATQYNYTLQGISGPAGFATLNDGTQGGVGGSVWTVWDAFALRDALAGNVRNVVNVRGRIDLTYLFTGSPGVRLNVGSHKSIIGADNDATIFGGGLQILNSQNVIIQNIQFLNALSYAPGEQPDGNGGIVNMVPGEFSEIDAIEARGSVNIWVDHCEFADDPWDAYASIRRHDGLIDVVRASSYVTISNNIFRNHVYTTLVGNRDHDSPEDIGMLKTTFYLNWYQGTDQRNPRVRWGEVHVFNNLYTDINGYGIGVGVSARVYVENNYFQNTPHAWQFPLGIIPEPMGHLYAANNYFDNSTFDTEIPNAVEWVPSQYYEYTVRDKNTVADYVRLHAGTF